MKKNILMIFILCFFTLSALSTVQILSPANDSFTDSQFVKLNWIATGFENLSYIVYLDINSNPQKKLNNYPIIEKSITVYLDEPNTYFWKVEAYFEGTKISESTVNSFTLEFSEGSGDSFQDPINARINRNYTDEISNSKRERWYKVTIPENGLLKVSVDGTLNMRIVKNDGHIYCWEYQTNSPNNPYYEEYFEAGTYYFYLFYTDKTHVYTFKTDFTPSGAKNEEDPFRYKTNRPETGNDSFQTAYDVKPNTSVKGHIGYILENGNRDTEEWYKVTINESGLLKVSVDGTLNMRIVKNDGHIYCWEYQTNSPNNPYYEEYFEAGTYYFYLFYTDYTGIYTLNINFK